VCDITCCNSNFCQWVIQQYPDIVVVLQPWPQNLVVEKDDRDLITSGKLLLRYKDER